MGFIIYEFRKRNKRYNKKIYSCHKVRIIYIIFSNTKNIQFLGNWKTIVPIPKNGYNPLQKYNININSNINQNNINLENTQIDLNLDD